MEIFSFKITTTIDNLHKTLFISIIAQMFPQQMDDQQNQQFRIISQVGSGIFARCYLCERRSDETRVVLKKIVLSEQAKNEAKLLLQCTSHEHVVNAFGSHLSDRALYIEIEYMPGGNLHELIKRNEQKPLKDKVVLKYTRQLASALEYVHGLRIIHRDVTPRNVLLTTDHKQVKLCDFGIALKLEEGRQVKGHIGQEGTIHYMAPEILQGRVYDFKVDIWSLGCVVYELVERKKAFPGCQDLSVFHKISKGLITWPKKAKLGDFIKDLLVSNETTRPSAQDVLALVDTYRQDNQRRRSFWQLKRTAASAKPSASSGLGLEGIGKNGAAMTPTSCSSSHSSLSATNGNANGN